MQSLVLTQNKKMKRLPKNQGSFLSIKAKLREINKMLRIKIIIKMDLVVMLKLKSMIVITKNKNSLREN